MRKQVIIFLLIVFVAFAQEDIEENKAPSAPEERLMGGYSRVDLASLEIK